MLRWEFFVEVAQNHWALEIKGATVDDPTSQGATLRMLLEQLLLPEANLDTLLRRLERGSGQDYGKKLTSDTPVAKLTNDDIAYICGALPSSIYEPYLWDLFTRGQAELRARSLPSGRPNFVTPQNQDGLQDLLKSDDLAGMFIVLWPQPDTSHYVVSQLPDSASYVRAEAGVTVTVEAGVEIQLSDGATGLIKSGAIAALLAGSKAEVYPGGKAVVTDPSAKVELLSEAAGDAPFFSAEGKVWWGQFSVLGSIAVCGPHDGQIPLGTIVQDMMGVDVVIDYGVS